MRIVDGTRMTRTTNIVLCFQLVLQLMSRKLTLSLERQDAEQAQAMVMILIAKWMLRKRTDLDSFIGIWMPPGRVPAKSLSHESVQCGGSDAWYSISTSMRSAAHAFLTMPVQWFEPKQVAAQVSPTCEATCLPKYWLQNLSL
jgi:hypothetical protein